MSFHHWPDDFLCSILRTPLSEFLPELSKALRNWSNTQHHAEQKKWQKQLSQFPRVSPAEICFADTIRIGTSSQLNDSEKKHLEHVLKCYMPWRKGPFELFGVHIDTEWRSDFKWQRILPYLPKLHNSTVLDVGCGSGYHLFRMHENGAKQVIGIDPTTLFFYQFQCFKQYLPDINVHYLPLPLEQMPDTKCFDVVFSMGVLYHRPDPLNFLSKLKQQLTYNGSLVLETLIIEGSEREVLMPAGRYAQMRNVYFIPSAQMLTLWLSKIGFKQIQLVEQNVTTINEQRSTAWMTNHSLIDFLDPTDPTRTIEGYPAPLRATIIATR